MMPSPIMPHEGPFFAADLLAWFDRSAARLPWREPQPQAYRVWVSEIMLQQTQVDTVIPYYMRFLARFPDVASLAAAPLNEVLKLWEGLGYYSRARNLHQTARIVMDRWDGQFPTSAAALRQLPGIGRYTAGAIASIVSGERTPVLDGNVIRVFSRLIDLADDVTAHSVQARLWALAESWLPPERSGDYNQALMELGRTVCRPRSPLCGECPLQSHCQACWRGTQAERPVKKKKAATPHHDVAAGLVRDQQERLLIAQRPLDGLLGGLWEFPGGKREPGETLAECLRRELREELAIEVEVGDLFVVVRHAFTHFKITLHAFECRHIRGTPQSLGVQDFTWVTEHELDDYSFGKADRLVIAALAKRRGMLL